MYIIKNVLSLMLFKIEVMIEIFKWCKVLDEEDLCIIIYSVIILDICLMLDYLV